MPSNRPKTNARPSNQRRLNVRLLICVSIPALLLGAGIVGLHSLQVNRTSTSLLVQAERAEAAGDLVKAGRLLKLFMAYQPNHPEALVKFALIQATLARNVEEQTQAIQLLEKALRVSPDRRDVRRRLIAIAISLKAYQTAEIHLQTQLGRQQPGEPNTQRSRTPENGELEYLLGQCSEAEGDYSLAARWFKDAIADAPEQIDAYLRLAEVFRNRLSDANAADRVMDAREIKAGLVASNGRAPRTYLERAGTVALPDQRGRRRRQARFTACSQRRRRALIAAEFAIERADFDQARRHLTIGLEQNPGSWRLSDSMASIERRSGNLVKVEERLRRGIETSADPEGRSRLMWVLADVLIDEDKWTDAKALMKRLGQDRVLPELLKYLDARIKAAESNWIEAAAELEAIYPLLVGKSALAYQSALLLGRCYERLGDIDRRYDAFRRAVALEPQATAGQLGRAETLAVMGRHDEAIRSYRNLMGKAPTVAPALGRLFDIAQP